MYIHIYNMCVYIYTYTLLYIYIHVHIYIYIYIYYILHILYINIYAIFDVLQRSYTLKLNFLCR